MRNLENFMNTITAFFLFPACSETWLRANPTPAQRKEHVTRDKVTPSAEQLRNRSCFIARGHHEGDIFNFPIARVDSAGSQGEVLNTNPWLEKFWTLIFSLFICQQFPCNLTVLLPLVLLQQQNSRQRQNFC